jgi:hypothetical protein
VYEVAKAVSKKEESNFPKLDFTAERLYTSLEVKIKSEGQARAAGRAIKTVSL